MRLTLVVALLAVACGKTERSPAASSGSAAGASGAVGNKKLGALSAGEAKDLCARVRAYRKETAALPGFAKVRCSTAALGAAGAPELTTPEAMHAACARELEGCLAQPVQMPDVDCDSPAGSAAVPGFMDELARCPDITVDQLFACTEEMRGLMIRIATDDACSVTFDPKNPLASTNAYVSRMQGPKCAEVERACLATK
jgi:hypothetical protein